MLSQAYPLDVLKDVLIPSSEWHPFPRADERETWDRLPEAIRRCHIQRGEEVLNYAWPSLPATLFLDFARIGNRSRYERESFARRTALCNLVIAECMEGEGRFLDDIVNGIWTICEESYWGVPAHIGVQTAGVGLPDTSEPTVDLFAAETVSLLAWTHYLLGPQLDGVSKLIRPRIAREADVRVLTPCLERTDFWWMGFGDRHVNNWNPWCNSNWLTAVLLLERDEERRLKAVTKILRSLDRFIDSYPADGGCDEGTSYWSRAGGSLFDCLELLRSATNGAIEVYDEELIRNIGRYIYRAHIGERYFINFADGPAVVHVSAPLLFRYGRRIGDEKLAALGAYAAVHQYAQSPCVSDSIGRQLPALFVLEEILAVRTDPPRVRDVWLEDIQVMAARDREGTAAGLYVATKGGHNAESHNHNDVGNFIVYVDGQPTIVDVGVETYTARTFSRERYQIWTMQSAYHNLPTIGGVMQGAGRDFAARQVAYTADDAGAELQLDIAGAYPPEAGLRSWIRRVRLNRGTDVQVTDTYTFEHLAAELTLSLMTPCQVRVVQPGELALEPARHTSAHLHLHYDADKLQVEIEDIPIEDGRLQTAWGEHLRRIVLRAPHPLLQDTWTLRLEP